MKHHCFFVMLYRFSLLAILVQQAVCVTASNCSHSPQIYKYDRADTRLNGRVIQRSVYGPPGYGEAPATDPKVKITILQLDCPIDIKPDPDAKGPETSNLSYFHKIKEIQLFFDNKAQKRFAQRHLGQTVIVNGRLEEAVAGGEYTKVTMTVEQIH